MIFNLHFPLEETISSGQKKHGKSHPLKQIANPAINAQYAIWLVFLWCTWFELSQQQTYYTCNAFIMSFIQFCLVWKFAGQMWTIAWFVSSDCRARTSLTACSWLQTRRLTWYSLTPAWGTLVVSTTISCPSWRRSTPQVNTDAQNTAANVFRLIFVVRVCIVSYYSETSGMELSNSSTT